VGPDIYVDPHHQAILSQEFQHGGVKNEGAAVGDASFDD
jgi:hypothetical protein